MILWLNEEKLKNEAKHIMIVFSSLIKKQPPPSFMTSHFLWQVIGPFCFKPFFFIVSRCWLKGILPHVLIKPFFNSHSEGIKAWETKWLLSGAEVQSIQPDSLILLLYNPNGILIPYYRANKTASMLLSGYKCSNTNYGYANLEKGLVCLGCVVPMFAKYST